MADISVTPASVVPGANDGKFIGTAGATITAGQTCYVDSADSNKVKLARANAATTDAVEGISVNGAASGQPITLQKDGDLNPGATLTVGETYVLSAAAAGGIAPIGDLGSNDYVSILGVATTTSNLKLKLNNSGVQKP